MRNAWQDRTDQAAIRRVGTLPVTSLEAGVDPKMLSDRMGHANTAITLQTYTHHSTGKERDLARSVSEVIEKALDLAGSQ